MLHFPLYFQKYSKLNVIFSWFLSMLSKKRKWCHALKIANGVKNRRAKQLYKLVSCQRYLLPCAPIKDSDQPAQPCSLIRVLNGHTIGSQGSNISSVGKLRLIKLYGSTDWFESSLYAHANWYQLICYITQHRRFLYLSNRHPGEGSRQVCTVSLDPSLLPDTKYGSKLRLQPKHRFLAHLE